MHAKSVVLALLLLFPAVAFADGIDRVSPSSIFAGNPEQFIALFGSNLAGAVGTIVVYEGPAGRFEVEASNAAFGHIDVWVPVPVAMTAGRYTIDVYADDGGGVVRHLGPATFDVVEQVIEAPPLLFTPTEVLIAEATSSRGAEVTFEVTAVSQGGSGLTFGCNPPSGSFFSINATNVTCSATDSFGTSTASFIVFVADTLPPVVTVPASFSTADAVVTFETSAVDAIDGNVPVECSPASGSTFATGVTHVVCFAKDSHANYGFGTFDVTVTGGLPVLHLPDDITAEATSPQGAFVNYSASADDGTISCNPASGSIFPIGATNVTCTATNAIGSVSGMFVVTVRDTTPPEIVRLTPSPENLWPPDHKMIAVHIEAVVFDAGDPNPLVQIISVSSNQPDNGTGDGDTAPDWEITGALTLNLRAERAGNVDRVYTITVGVVDAYGNTSVKTCTVKVSQPRTRTVR